MRKYLLVLLSLSMFLSEIILRINQTFGVFLYSLLITGCLIALSKKESLDNYGKLIIVFMILPIIRIVELFLVFEIFWRVFVVYFILLFLVSFYCLKFKINPGYTKEKLGLLPWVILVAVFLGFMGNVLFEFDKYLGFVFLIPIIAYSEEVLFRGLIQNLGEKSCGVFCSIFFSSFLYGIFSLSFGFSVIFIFIIAFVIGLTYYFTKNIFLTIAINMIFHLFLFVLPKFLF